MIDGAIQDYPLTLDKFLTHAAKWHPQAEIVTASTEQGDVRTSYSELMTLSLATSSALAELGVRQGDRVATLAWNTQTHVEVWYAIMGMGAVCHTLNPRLTAEQLAAMVVQSEARILIASGDLLSLARRIVDGAPEVEHLIVIDADKDTVIPANGAVRISDLNSLLSEASGTAVWGNFSELAPSGLCFTSGTTGSPKGVTYTHRSSFLHTLRVLQADVMAISGADTILTVVPMFHANAWGLPFAAPAVGAKLVLPGRKTDGASLARLIAAENVTVGVGVPTVWLSVLEHLANVDGDLPSLERIIVGGSPMPPALMERLERRLGVKVQTSWGMTELSPSGTVTPPWVSDRSAESAGRPAIGVDLLLTDATGEPLSNQRGEEGHLHVRGSSVVQRYFGHEQDATDAAGWFPTGDLARIDTKGQLLITGRAKDLIKSGGEWINPAEIEALIGAVPEVSLAAVIGRPDPKWGERPILLVEMREMRELDDEDLLASLHGHVASWWIPDTVVRIESMPLAPTGKIDKIRLRAEYGEVDERQL